MVSGDDTLFLPWISTLISTSTPRKSVSDNNGEIICEHFQKNITCPAGQIIKLGYANYGRTSDIPCQSIRKYITRTCKSTDSLKIAKKECEGKNHCIAKALNSVFGNPCPGVIKYLELRYQCVPEKTNGTNKNELANVAEPIRDHFLLNPALSEDGITITMKLKILNDLDQSYSGPRFIFDSGGHYDGEGVSMYVLKDELHCVVAVKDGMWATKARITRNEWILVILTWQHNQGIILYINGLVSGSSINKIHSSAEMNNTSNQFVFGRSISTSDGEGFSRFQTTVFSLLKHFVTKSESIRLFSYYVGRAIAKGMEVSAMTSDTTIICEYESRTISCPSDQVLEIVNCNYGRTSARPCAWGTHHVTNCTLPSSVDIARAHCNGKNSCELTAKSGMWKANPCVGVIKYVEVKYICNEVKLGESRSTTYIGNEDPNSLVIP